MRHSRVERALQLVADQLVNHPPADFAVRADALGEIAVSSSSNRA